MKPLSWPESYRILIDFETSLYLNGEPRNDLVSDLKYKNYQRVADRLLAICDRDMSNCQLCDLKAANYWTCIFTILALRMLAGWYLVLEPKCNCEEQRRAVFHETRKLIEQILANNPEACNFDTGLLYEFKGDVEIFIGNAADAADSYTRAATYYNSFTHEEQAQLITHPSVEPLFLQYDIIWKNKLNNSFADAYDFVDNFGNRIINKLAYAMLLTVREPDLMV